MEIVVSVTKESTCDVFERVAMLQEVFEDKVCGLCGSEKVQYVVREAEGNKFYELQCKASIKVDGALRQCRGKLTFGKEKESGKLYPRRYETHKEGKDKGKAIKEEATGKAKVLGKWGWTRYNTVTGKEE